MNKEKLSHILDVDVGTAGKFLEYHKSNPDVWENFEKLSLKVAKHRAHYGAKAIMEVVRFHIDMHSLSEKEFKISNNYTAYYSRMFMWKHPQHDGFFRTKTLKGLKDAA